MNPRKSVLPASLILMLLLGTQPVAMDLYLPALPQIAAGFGGPAAHVQWTLTAFVLAFGLAQLFVGSIADRHGRRLTLLWGLALYVAAACISVLAGSLAVLVGARVLQGMATAACVISVRAVIRDSHTGALGLGVMARSMTGSSVIGLLSPILGGLLSQAFGWQSTLVLVGAFGAAAWLVVYHSFSETYTRSNDTANDTGGTPLGTLLGHSQFIFSSLLAGASFSGAVCFLLLSSFIFIGEFGLSQIAYGLIPAVCTLAFLIGTVCCRHYLKRVDVPRAVRLGAWLSVIGGCSQLLLWLAQIRTPWALLVPQCIYMLGHGFHQPCGQGGAVAPFPQFAGRAASVSGFIITAVAFIAGQLVSQSGVSASQTLVITMALLAGVIAVIGWIALPRAYRQVALAGA